MATYEESGVNLNNGDKSSKIAYGEAKKTFSARDGRIGKPVLLDGGFSGALDFGDFYLLQNADGVGSKISIADATGDYTGSGYDLLAMVADDAICVGAETVSITNTIDTNSVDPKVIGNMMNSLRKACLEQNVVIPGGEIAELPGLVNGNSWNATTLGIVEKDKFIDGKSVKPGDKIFGLKSKGFRSNGFSLIRFILKNKFGEKWFDEPYCSRRSWGKLVLTPSFIYSKAVLDLIGRYKEERIADIKSVIHITGGGLPGNILRGLNGYGAMLDNLFSPIKMMLRLQEFGEVTDEEAYRVWNMGVGMVLISDDEDKIKGIMSKYGIVVKQIGTVIEEKKVILTSRGFYKKEEVLTF